MTTDECKRILEHPIIDGKGLCDETGLSFSKMYMAIKNGRELTKDESQKIEAYLKIRGVEWRDLIKEGL